MRGGEEAAAAQVQLPLPGKGLGIEGSLNPCCGRGERGSSCNGQSRRTPDQVSNDAPPSADRVIFPTLCRLEGRTPWATIPHKPRCLGSVPSHRNRSHPRDVHPPQALAPLLPSSPGLSPHCFLASLAAVRGPGPTGRHRGARDRRAMGQLLQRGDPQCAQVLHAGN